MVHNENTGNEKAMGTLSSSNALNRLYYDLGSRVGFARSKAIRRMAICKGECEARNIYSRS